ncbi:hypothetical protein B0H11DRAFT_2279584 [Mycena galericulata]|nr:hypothetical protein B0H11DRAFT_2279584 [Mycena galericulata]
MASQSPTHRPCPSDELNYSVTGGASKRPGLRPRVRQEHALFGNVTTAMCSQHPGTWAHEQTRPALRGTTCTRKIRSHPLEAPAQKWAYATPSVTSRTHCCLSTPSSRSGCTVRLLQTHTAATRGELWVRPPCVRSPTSFLMSASARVF